LLEEFIKLLSPGPGDPAGLTGNVIVVEDLAKTHPVEPDR
jgi:hypothetical protein